MGFQKLIAKIKKKFFNILRMLFSKAPKRKFFYAFFYKHCRIKSNSILVESFHGSNISDSSLALVREILKSYPGKYKIYYGTIDKKKHQEFIESIGLDVELIDVNTFRYTKILATAEYLINNSSFPVYFVKRDEQKYIQTWHGTPLKTLGKDMRLGIESMYNVQHNFLQADYITFPNDFTRDVMMECYNLNPLYTGKVVMAGYPRNEIFFDSESGKELKKKLGLENKTVYGYMPTWRGTSNHSISTDVYEKTVAGIFKKLDKKLKDDQVFFVNFHPILKDAISLDKYKHIKPFPQGVDNYSFLNCCDALVTDYSSVFFDFSLTKKPIVLFMYDYDEYMHDRGMYMDVASLPFKKIYDTDEFADALSSESFMSDSYEDTEYFKTFFKYDSPDISEKLLELLFFGKENDLEITDYSFNKERRLKVIYPERVRNFADLNTISKVADENSVVCLEKRWFKKSVGPDLHDYFNNCFKYVVITRTTPRTYFEEILCKLKVKSALSRVHLREIERTFPNLNIDPDFVRDYSAYEKDCNIHPTDYRQVNIKSIEVKGKDFSVAFENSGYELISLVLLNKDTITNIVDIPETERNSNSVLIPLQKFIEGYEVYYKEKRKIGVIAIDKSTNEKCVLLMSKTSDFNDFSTNFEKPLIANYNLVTDYYKENFKKLFNSNTEREKDVSSLYDLNVTEVPVAILPYYVENALNICFSKEDEYLETTYQSGSVKKVKTKGNKCKIVAEFPQDSSANIKGAVLKYRSKVEDVVIPLECKTIVKKNKTTVVVDVEFTPDMPLKPIYWDIRAVVEKFGSEQLIKLNAKDSMWLKFKFYVVNCICKIDGKNLVFPYVGKNGVLCFCYKETSEYDTQLIKLKEFFVYLLYLVFGAYWRRKNIWLVYEKFSNYAQDNGYFFFKYCMENLTEEQKKNIFYVIDKRSPDYKNIKNYDKHVIQFMSMKHMMYCLAMKICIASDSKPHLYKWRSTPSFIVLGLQKKKELFLQHGVTALKKVHSLFGKQGSSPMTYFVTTGKVEQEIAVTELLYTPETAPITGFARWDALVDKENKNDRFVLVMPTWRSWLEDVTDEEFMQSDYYNRYTSLLKSPKLAEILKNGNTRVVFYIHPKFAGYIDNFKDLVSENISYIPFGQEPLNELMMKCSMLITDYSSVCWDVYYLDKPVLFYQFDYDKYSVAHGSYINMETSLFGNRSLEEDDLIKDIEHFVNNGFVENEKDRLDALKYFEYRDSNNSKRIYEFLKKNNY